MLSDEELAVLVMDEDSAEAFDELLKRYRPVIYSIAGKLFSADNIQHATKYEAILEGESALGLAIVNYDRSTGNFRRYAVKCIQGAILNYLNGNRSLVIPLALQRRLQKVKSAIRAVTGREASEVDITRVRSLLVRKYPDEAVYWNRFLESYVAEVLDARDDISLDSRPEDGRSMHEVLAGGAETGTPVERRDIAARISRVVMDAWLEIVRKETRGRSRRRLEILYRYYVKGESSEEIVRWLEGSGLNGYDLFRQVKNRGFRQLCRKYEDVFRDMAAELNRLCDSVIISVKETEGFCNDLMVFLRTLAGTGILMEGYNAQS